MIINTDLYNKISEKTMTKYSSYNISSFEENEVYVSEASVTCMLEDLLCEIHTLEEKIEDREQDIQDNYRRLNPEELIERIEY